MTGLYKKINKSGDPTRFMVWPGLVILVLVALVSQTGPAAAATYTLTAHGNSSTGVDRDNIGVNSDPDFSGHTPGNCAHCHEQHASIGGTSSTARPYALFMDNYGSTNRNAQCYHCHEQLSVGSVQGYGRYDYYLGQTLYEASSHDASANMSWPGASPPGPNYLDDGNCNNCHNPHGVRDATGVIPYMLFVREENLCNECHDGITANFDIEDLVTNSTYKHEVGLGSRDNEHTVNENNTTFTTMHVECQDCHNPHTAKGDNPISYATGITVTNSATPGNDATYSTNLVLVTNRDDQYKICFKCHSSWGAGPVSGTANLAIPLNTNNDSFHNVETTANFVNNGTGTGIFSSATFNHTVVTGGLEYVQVMMPRDSFTYSDFNLRNITLRCSDCHGPGDTGAGTKADGGVNVPEGPHGSEMANMLKIPNSSIYDSWDDTTTISGGDAWCFNCHSPTFSGSGFAGASTHATHGSRTVNAGSAPYGSVTSTDQCWACHQASPHGQTGSGTTGQRHHLFRADMVTDDFDKETSGNYNQHGNPPTIPMWDTTDCTP